MLNRKAPYMINEAYESDADVINDTRKLSVEINSILDDRRHEAVEDFIAELENDDIRNRSTLPAPPLRSTMSGDNLIKTQLSGIPEEIRPDNSNKNIHTNMGFQNMSLSNFKMLRENDATNGYNDPNGLNRDASHASILHMKEVDHETPIQIGRNFRKISTFVITPGSDDKMNIKMIDGRKLPDLFIELDYLYLNPMTNNYYWVEKFRWLKFEEEYNYHSKRFDGAHMSPLSIRGISNFRKLFAKGEVLMDCQHDRFIDVLNRISQSITNAGVFTEMEKIDIRDALILEHHHPGDGLKVSPSEASFHRFDDESQRFQRQLDNPMSKKRSVVSMARLDDIQKKMNFFKLEGRLEPGTEALSVQIGALDSLKHSFSIFIRLNNPIQADGLNEINVPLRFFFIVFGPKSKEQELLEIGRVFSTMMSNLEFREIGYSANTKEDLLEASKFFVTNSVLVPLSKLMSQETLAEMLPQMKYYYNQFHSEQTQRIFDNMKIKMTQKNQEVTLSQISNGQVRKISVNPKTIGENVHFGNGTKDIKDQSMISVGTNAELKGNKARRVILQFCPPLRYFINDWKGLKTRYRSDYTDAFTKETAPIVFIGMIFIYFVVMAPAITFGALLNAVNPKMTITMMLLASGFFQLFYCVFGGQPLEVIGITGPVFAAEKVLGALSLTLEMDLGAMRLWIGVYLAIIGMVFMVFNGVIIMKHIRRSVEEIYNFLVAVIYILSAFFSMFKILPYTITEAAINGSNIQVIVAERRKFGIGGTTLFLAFFMANFCLILVGIKKGSFFRRKIRYLLGSLNVPLGIILIIAMMNIFFQTASLPTLNVPPSDQVNFSLWFNIPTVANVMAITPISHGLCFAISISIFAIMTCEVCCNGIMASKSERKLLKPSLFSINFFYVHVLFPLMSGILGWPFVSGGTVRTHIHCMAMSKWSLPLPGVPSKITGVVEQRMSGILVGAFVLLSVFLGSALRYIPMASMYGMFLYMGIMGSVDLIFIQRLTNIFQRRKYWDKVDFLKDFPTWNIAILVMVQVFFMCILILLNCIAEFTTIAWTPILFSATIMLYAFVRGYILPRWPRLNTDLSKMDKKHKVILYADRQTTEQVIVTVDQTGVNMKVVQTENVDDNEYEMSVM